MSDSIKIRSRHLDGYREVKILISHPMENGRNRDANGDLIPAHFIEQLVVKLNEQTALTIDMAGSVSKNPFFTIRLKTGQPGDKISVFWADNRRTSDSAEHLLDD